MGAESSLVDTVASVQRAADTPTRSPNVDTHPRRPNAERSLIYYSRQDHYRRADSHEKSRILAASGAGFSPVELSANNPEIQ